MKSLRYIVDSKGKKLSVVLPIKTYQKLMKKLEEIEDIRLYDKAMTGNEDSIPIDKVFEMIEAKRRNKAIAVQSALDKPLTHVAGEETLAKDWLTEKENQAWKDL